jgi:hypothetical protein
LDPLGTDCRESANESSACDARQSGGGPQSA